MCYKVKVNIIIRGNTKYARGNGNVHIFILHSTKSTNKKIENYPEFSWINFKKLSKKKVLLNVGRIRGAIPQKKTFKKIY